MVDGEGLSVCQAVEWCGSGATMREVRLLCALACLE